MAKNVTIAGAAYSAVPSIDVPQTGGGTASFFDVSDTTATAADVAQGKDFYAADGTKTTGTASGGGGSSWELVWEQDFEVSTTSTSAGIAGTIDLPQDIFSQIHSDKLLVISIKDVAGTRNGHFYSSWSYWAAPRLNNGTLTTGAWNVVSLPDGEGTYPKISMGTASTQAGVYAYSVSYTSTSTRVTIRRKYNSTVSYTIDGTYRVRIYLLDLSAGPGGYFD